MSKPSLFIGSSREGLEPARALAYQLKDDAEVTVWNEGVFEPGLGSLESLVNALEQFDFAALLLTADDLTVSRGRSTPSPRDNVMFELGLFLGRLGRSRTFAVCSEQNLKLATDLAGVTVLTFGQRKDGNLIAALGPAGFRIRTAIRDLGIADSRGLRRLGAATSEVEDLTQRLLNLAELQARSRRAELQIFIHHFGHSLSKKELEQLELHLKELKAEELRFKR